jgi:hypothetical protein
MKDLNVSRVQLPSMMSTAKIPSIDIAGRMVNRRPRINADCCCALIFLGAQPNRRVWVRSSFDDSSMKMSCSAEYWLMRATKSALVVSHRSAAFFVNYTGVNK